jgi:hypothetical protein
MRPPGSPGRPRNDALEAAEAPVRSTKKKLQYPPSMFTKAELAAVARRPGMEVFRDRPEILADTLGIERNLERGWRELRTELVQGVMDRGSQAEIDRANTIEDPEFRAIALDTIASDSTPEAKQAALDEIAAVPDDYLWQWQADKLFDALPVGWIETVDPEPDNDPFGRRAQRMLERT